MLLDDIVRDYLKTAISDIIKDLKKEIVPGIKEKQWYNLREAVELKGGSYNTVKSNLKLQPNGGKEDALLHGRRVWTAQSVKKWLDVTDKNRSRYLCSL